ncbi:unnamed protein product [Paramecium sonneborni]|uniref:Uncharacterized protein n=1 Tax=Paramecium sonneborni TaxID=65129 RepID=A0A8S1K5T6_9CILI|nr:unnamed protein product [Paramecium sonneborni]
MINNQVLEKLDEKKEKNIQQVGQEKELIQKNFKIKSEKTISAHNKNSLKDLIQTLTKFLQQLEQNIQALVQGVYQCRIEQQMQQRIIELIEKFNNKCNSLKQSFQKSGQKLSSGNPTQQNHDDDDDLIEFESSDQEKSLIGQNNIVDNQQIVGLIQIQDNQNENFINAKKEKCIINHKQIKNFQSDYQQIIQAYLEQQLKNNKQSIKCMCNQNIKFKDLNISNQNLFEMIQNQQLVTIFNQFNQMVLKCTNSFCSFKCFEQKSNNTQDQMMRQQYYCPACNQNSILGMMN